MSGEQIRFQVPPKLFGVSTSTGTGTGTGTGTCNKVLFAKKKITVKPYIFEMQQIASTIRSRLGVLDT